LLIGRYIEENKSPPPPLYQEGRKMFPLDKGECQRQRDLRKIRFLMKF
jgi:hypothetical protein